MYIDIIGGRVYANWYAWVGILFKYSKFIKIITRLTNLNLKNKLTIIDKWLLLDTGDTEVE